MSKEATGGVENHELEMSRRKRVEAAELNAILAKKRCLHCATVGAWTVYDKEEKRGRVRYIRCKGCAHTDLAVVMCAVEGKGHEASEEKV